MSEANKAVFLSYASQDAEAAKRICDALRAAGVEVWFDQSELVGGDAWDAKIRKQIKECALFVPIISTNTQARLEGYFRLEWLLAVERSQLMADDQPFIVPVVIDGITDSAARVPDRFRSVQWTRLPAGDPPAGFGTHVRRLLDGSPEQPHHRRPTPASTANGGSGGPSRRRWLRPVIAAVAAGSVLTIGSIVTSRRAEKKSTAAVATSASPEKLSPARELVTRASAVLRGGSVTRNQLAAAGELCARALQLDSTDPIVWVTAAKTDLAWIYPYGYDMSIERRHRAEEEAARATALGPDLFDVRVTQARVLAHAVATPSVLKEAEKTLRDLRASHPDDLVLVYYLGEVLRQQGRYDEAAKLFEQSGGFEVAGWSYAKAGDGHAALIAVERSPRTVTSVMLKASLQRSFEEDPDKAQATIDQLRPSELLAQMPAAIAIYVAMYRRDWNRMLELAQGLSEEYLDSYAFRGPRRFFTGFACELAGRPAQAEAEWRAGLALIQARLTATPDDRQLLLWASWLHAALNETAEAERLFARSQTIAGLNGDAVDFTNLSASLRLRHKDAVLAWAETMLQTKTPHWERLHPEMRYSPEWDWLRGDPRFEKLLRDNVPPGAKPLDPATK